MENNMINFPTSKEKQKAILIAFQNGHKLTTQQCYRNYATTELRKIVCRLRNKGYDIRGERLNGDNFKTYFLVPTSA